MDASLPKKTGSVSQSELSFADSQYRCVCGNLVDWSSDGAVDCPQCGRRCTFQELDGEHGEETVLATLCESRVKAPPIAGAPDPLIDRCFGHFRIVEPLGFGGMGSVYRALDESLQRYVALKVIREPEGDAQSTKQTERLVQEARAQARVNHGNVVHIYYVDQSEGTPFFAMELVNGPTLKDRLEQGPLPFAEVVSIGLQIARALRHALKYDIVHGDIKPSNLLQSETSEVKISDFGLARRLSELIGEEGVLAGTPNYLSPESAARKSTDFRSDLYSLGVTLFELTFGKLPYSYETQSVEERLKAHQFREVEFPEVWPDSVPENWRGVLESLLAKRPEDRFHSYDDLIAQLDRARPLSLTKAGRFQRVLAWWGDCGLLFALYELLQIPQNHLPLPIFVIESSLIQFGMDIASMGIVAALAVYVQWRWGGTPCKKLFQLRVVDSHGLPPSRMKIMMRTGFQFLVVWLLSAFDAFSEIGLDVDEPIQGLLLVIPLLVEFGFVMFTSGRLALHDKLLKTRVVLDARVDGKDS